MSSKWTALPAAAQVNNADIECVAQGGVSKQITRPLFLTAPTGEAIELVGNFSHLQIDAVGNINLLLSPTFTFELTDGTTDFLSVDSAANVVLESQTTGSVTVACGGTNMVIQGMAGTIVFSVPGPGSGKFSAPYTPATPGDWAGNPTTIHEAIDRIAAVVSVGGVSPIP